MRGSALGSSAGGKPKGSSCVAEVESVKRHLHRQAGDAVEGGFSRRRGVDRQRAEALVLVFQFADVRRAVVGPGAAPEAEGVLAGLDAEGEAEGDDALVAGVDRRQGGAELRGACGE